MRRKPCGSIRTAVTVAIAVTLLIAVTATTAATAAAVAVPANRGGEQSAWSAISTVSETAGGMMRAVMGECEGETGGSFKRVVLGAVSCVLRTG